MLKMKVFVIQLQRLLQFPWTVFARVLVHGIVHKNTEGKKIFLIQGSNSGHRYCRFFTVWATRKSYWVTYGCFNLLSKQNERMILLLEWLIIPRKMILLPEEEIGRVVIGNSLTKVSWSYIQHQDLYICGFLFMLKTFPYLASLTQSLWKLIPH